MPRRVRTIWRRLQGWRTFIFFTPAFLLTLLDLLHAIDFQQTLVDLGLPEGSAKAVVAVCFLLAIVLRAYTTTPPLRPVDPAEGSR